MASTTTSSFPSTSFNSLTPNPLHRTRHSPPSYVTLRRSPPTISAAYSTTTVTKNNTSLEATSFYEVLGIQACASGKEIKAAYRKLARVLHPDVSEKDATSSSEEFIRVNEAYNTLSDPKKRADYDRMMWLQGRRFSYYTPNYCNSTGGTNNKYATTSSSGFSGYSTRRTWETDQCW